MNKYHSTMVLYLLFISVVIAISSCTRTQAQAREKLQMASMDSNVIELEIAAEKVMLRKRDNFLIQKQKSDSTFLYQKMLELKKRRYRQSYVEPSIVLFARSF